MRRYILKGHTPIECPDLLTWARQLDEITRIVNKTVLKHGTVSTVFLGLDHSLSDDGPPLLFETMVFRGPLDQTCERYATWEDAEQGHGAMVRRVESL